MSGKRCPYLDTIKRHLLDFDFEKVCSISLSDQNVYACLVCGKYFQGRGKSSHAYIHSMNADHHVFVHLEKERFYCLPENYEIIDASLKDIEQVINPKYSIELIQSLNKPPPSQSLIMSAKSSGGANVFRDQARGLDGSVYVPGAVGLNNIKANDYINVIVQALSQVKPLRDFFLLPENYDLGDSLSSVYIKPTSPLVLKFGELIRKMWNPFNYKGHVSPHDFVHAVSVSSKKRFKVTEQSQAIDFLTWFLNEINKQLLKVSHQREKVLNNLPDGKSQDDEEYAALMRQRKTVQSGETMVSKCFQGKMKVTSQKLMPTEEEIQVAKEDGVDLSLLTGEEEEFRKRVTRVPYLFLTLELPSRPLFVNETENDIIPQIPLMDILNKFDGKTENLYRTHRDSHQKRFELLDPLPSYLIFFFKRFQKNNFFLEKNPTIVNFPIMNLDLSEYIPVTEQQNGKTLSKDSLGSRFNLIANVVYDGNAEVLENSKESTESRKGSKKGGTSAGNVSRGTYRVHIKHSCTGKWFEIENLIVKEILPQMMPLTETYLQIWEKSV